MHTKQEIRNAFRVGTMTPAEIRELMKMEGQKIDPQSADVFWKWGQVMDPYGMYPDLSECFGHLYFARAPGSDIWVEFVDLPTETSVALWKRLSSGKPAETVPPFNNHIERIADAIIKVYGYSIFEDEPNRARALKAAQAALDVLQGPDATTS